MTLFENIFHKLSGHELVEYVEDLKLLDPGRMTDYDEIIDDLLNDKVTVKLRRTIAKRIFIFSNVNTSVESFKTMSKLFDPKNPLVNISFMFLVAHHKRDKLTLIWNAGVLALKDTFKRGYKPTIYTADAYDIFSQYIDTPSMVMTDIVANAIADVFGYLYQMYIERIIANYNESTDLYDRIELLKHILFTQSALFNTDVRIVIMKMFEQMFPSYYLPEVNFPTINQWTEHHLNILERQQRLHEGEVYKRNTTLTVFRPTPGACAMRRK